MFRDKFEKDCSDYKSNSCPKFMSPDTNNNLYKKINKDKFIFGMFGCWGTYCRSEEDTLNIPEFSIENLSDNNSEIIYEDDVIDDRYSSREAYNLLNQYCEAINPELIIIAGDNVYTDYNLGEQMGLIRKKFKNFLGKKNLTIEELKKYSNSEDINKVIKAFKKNNIADIIYNIDKQLKEGFENCFGRIKSDFLIGIGNHDIETCNIINYQLNYSNKNAKTRWNLPALSYNYIYELIDGTKINFIFIDTNLYSERGFCDPQKNKNIDDINDMIDEQHKWMKSVLGENKDCWNIIIGHEPVITNRHKIKNKKEPVTFATIKILSNFIKENMEYIDMYMCADEHNQQLIYYKNIKNDKIPVVISGSGGAVLDRVIYKSTESEDIAETIYTYSSVGFVSSIVTKKSIVISYVNRDSENVDNYTIRWKR